MAIAVEQPRTRARRSDSRIPQEVLEEALRRSNEYGMIAKLSRAGWRDWGYANEHSAYVALRSAAKNERKRARRATSGRAHLSQTPENLWFPQELIARHIERWIAKLDDPDHGIGGIGMLAERTGIPERRIYDIRNQKGFAVSLRVVDQLFTGMNEAMTLHTDPDLAAIYELPANTRNYSDVVQKAPWQPPTFDRFLKYGRENGEDARAYYTVAWFIRYFGNCPPLDAGLERAA